MKLVVFGREVAVEETSKTQGFLDVEVTRSFDLYSNRAQFEPLTIGEADLTQIVEVEDEDGFVDITTVGDLYDLNKERISRGSKKQETLILNDLLLTKSEDSVSRGKGWFKKLLKVKFLKAPDIVASMTIKELTEWLEKKNMPREGIYRCPKPLELTKVNRIQSSKEPIFLLIHGTGGNTASSFGGFQREGDTSIWDKITTKYDDRVYAWEHRTLSKGPIQNALELLEVVPKNAVLHIMSTSRGGLVGDVLSRANVEGDGEIGFSELEIAAFEKQQGFKEDAKRLREINELLETKKIRVERFVRVACPAAGTTLASKRLDLYFKIILNLLGLIPFLKANPIFGFTRDFLIALVKKKADASLLPGIEAMMPSSMFIKVINNPTVIVNSELLVISGDAVPSGGLLNNIKTRLIDLYYLAENDYVVNTAAMYGGVKRTKQYYFFDQQPNTNHFNYFSNPQTQNAILVGLSGEASTSGHFQVIEQSRKEEVSKIISKSRSADPHAPIAIVIPGIMGSRLRAGNKKIWANKGRLFLGGMKHLHIEATDVVAYDLMGSAYADFVESLSTSYQVKIFPFDWRRTLIESGDRLAVEIEHHLNTSNKPINLIAHSMGGLLVHAMYNRHKELWARFVARDGSKVLFLGSPLRGSHIIPQVFMRDEFFFKMLHNIDIIHSQKELLGILTDYPGILELLPFNTKGGTAEDGINYFNLDIYKKLDALDEKFVKPDSARLKKAKEFSEMVSNDPIGGDNVYYIAGKDVCTPARLVQDANKKGKKYRLLATTKGDGRVTWETGIPENLNDQNIWYMDATHGDLCNEPKYFDALFEILRTGTTEKLPRTEITTRGEEKELFEMPMSDPTTLRSDGDWEAQLMGVTPSRSLNNAIKTPVRVQVTHGDLGNSKFPVAIGHHEGDGIVSAERVIDNYMGGRLSNYHAAGLYPGALQTSLAILNNDDHFEGALILGLGDFGKLTKGDLEKTFTHGLIDLAMKHCEQVDHCDCADSKEKSKIGISTLLIGSRYSGLSLHESILSIMGAVSNANKTLERNQVCSVARIEAVEFIELYEDLAITAARVVNDLLEDDRFTDFELSKPLLKKVPGRRQKIANANNTDWWHRLRITEVGEKEDETAKPIHFVSITDKARSEVTVLPTQRKLVESLIEESVVTVRFNRDLAKTIYTLIIPNELKDFASDKRDIVLQLDKKTAEYPWELLYDPTEPGRKPISIQGGMIRQLETMNSSRGLVRYVKQDTAFVLGDPITPDDFQELPGALKEAENIEMTLKTNGFEVTSSYQETAQEAIIKLFQNNYRIIHIAAHGIADKDDPLKSGVVLSNGILITPAEIKQMTEIPEFVFINCCFSGDMEGDAENMEDRNILAANLGTQFIEKGVKAIVIAGWAVDDRAAKVFSEELYEKMLGGAVFGEAVRRARERVYRDFGNTNTWGAYQCYGDQFFVLRKGSSASSKKARTYIHPKEALIDIRNLRSSSDVRSSGEVESVVKRLDDLTLEIPMTWITRTDISEAIGSAYFELREYQKSVHYYNLLRKSDGDEFTLLGMRSLSNLYMKAALENARILLLNKENKALIKTYIEQSELLADWLLKLGETRYRRALMGGNFKRKSIAITSLFENEEEQIEQRMTALKNSRDAYRKSYEIRKDHTGKDDYYSLLNWLTLEEILSFYGEKKTFQKKSDVDALVSKAKDERLSKVDGSPSFWDSVAEAAFFGYELFTVVSNLKRQEEIVASMLTIYQRAWKIGGSLRKSDNIIEHFRFVLETLEAVPAKGLSRVRAEQLENIKRTFGNLYLGLSGVLGNFQVLNRSNEEANEAFKAISNTLNTGLKGKGAKRILLVDEAIDSMATYCVERMQEDANLESEGVEEVLENIAKILAIPRMSWAKVLQNGEFKLEELQKVLSDKKLRCYPFE